MFRGFPVDKFKGDRLGLVLAFWGIGIVLGRPLISQTDYTTDDKTFGMLLLLYKSGMLHGHVHCSFISPTWHEPVHLLFCLFVL